MTGEPPRRGSWDPFGKPTRWSIVARACMTHFDADARAAWIYLYDRYRTPLIARARNLVRTGEGPDEVVDDFFNYLVTSKRLRSADPERGKLRQFLQKGIAVFILDRRRENRLRAVSLENIGQDSVPSDENDGEAIVSEEEDAAWAAQVLDNALRLIADLHPRHAEVLVAIYGLRGHEPVSRDELAVQYGVKVNSIDKLASRARGELRERLRHEIRDSVTSDHDEAEEREWLEARLLEAHPRLSKDTFSSGSRSGGRSIE